MADELDQVTEPSLAEVIFAAVDRKLRGVHTCAPGKIVSYDNTTQTATIQLAVELETTADEYVEVPPLKGVLVLQPVTTGFWLHVPPSTGDGVLVLFCEQDPSSWLVKGATGKPHLKRRHGFYPVAILGFTPESARLSAAQAPLTAAVLASSGAEVAVDATGVRLGDQTAVDPVVLVAKLKAVWAAALSSAIAAAAPTDGGVAALTALQTYLAGVTGLDLAGATKVTGV